MSRRQKPSGVLQDILKTTVDPKISKSIDWDLGRIALWIEILKPPQPDASIKSQYHDGIEQEPYQDGIDQQPVTKPSASAELLIQSN